jgi:hypothetical protein
MKQYVLDGITIKYNDSRIGTVAFVEKNIIKLRMALTLIPLH